MTLTPKRGHVYRMSDPEYGTLHCLVVSTVSSASDQSDCLAVRVTVTGKRNEYFPYWVRMSSGDPCGGYVVVHDLDRVDIEELAEDLGPLNPATMTEVELTLRKMLGL